MGDAQASQDQQQGGQRRGRSSTYFSSFLSKIFLLFPNHLSIENISLLRAGPLRRAWLTLVSLRLRLLIIFITLILYQLCFIIFIFVIF